MKCEACLELMDDLIELELNDSMVREVTAHIAMCAPCSHLYAQLRAEQELYGNYLQHVEPTTALWTNLRLELEKDRVTRKSHHLFQRQRWLAIALEGLNVTPQMATALVLITIGLVIGIMVWRTTNDSSKHQVQNPGVTVQPSSGANRAAISRAGNNTDRRGSANDDHRKIRPRSPRSGDRGREIQVSAFGRAGRRTIERSTDGPAVDQVVRRAEQQYLSAIEILSSDFKRRRSAISPALLVQLERALAEVDRNIAATRRVAREQPRDPVAVQYLALAYEKKVELLREVTSW
jgi:hypothetical protein